MKTRFCRSCGQPIALVKMVGLGHDFAFYVQDLADVPVWRRVDGCPSCGRPLTKPWDVCAMPDPLCQAGKEAKP